MIYIYAHTRVCVCKYIYMRQKGYRASGSGGQGVYYSLVSVTISSDRTDVSAYLDGL